MPKARGRAMNLPGSGGQEETAGRALGASSSRLCKHIHRHGNIQVLSPSGPFLTGPPFSIHIPGSFQTFLVNLWPPRMRAESLNAALQMPTFQGV